MARGSGSFLSTVVFTSYCPTLQRCMKIQQRKNIVLLVLLLACLVIYFRTKHARALYSSKFSENRIISCEDPSLVFARTHKTGSATLIKVLRRYQERRRLLSKEPLSEFVTFPYPFLGGYPGFFRSDLAMVATNSKIKKLTDEKPSFLMNHMRWNKEEAKKLMSRNAKYVTILRHPLRQFESSFHFYYGKYSSGKDVRNPISCHKFPHLFVTNGRWVDISEYLSIAETSLNESAPWFFRSRNFQSYDLGVDPLNMRDDYVLQQAKELDDTFHLVLILEHLLESLVLLKDLLCMNWEEILPFPRIHTADYQRHEFNDAEKRIVRKLTSQDQLLYDYFNATLWRKIEEYGTEKMAKDVATLQEMIREAEKDTKPKERKKTTKKLTRQVGVRMRKDDDSEANFLIRLLTKKAGDNASESNLVKNLAHYMVKNYGWCPSLK